MEGGEGEAVKRERVSRERERKDAERRGKDWWGGWIVNCMNI